MAHFRGSFTGGFLDGNPWTPGLETQLIALDTVEPKRRAAVGYSTLLVPQPYCKGTFANALRLEQ